MAGTMHSLRRKCCRLAATLLVLTLALPQVADAAAPVRSSEPPLADLWDKLDAARLYRCAILSGGRCTRNSYSQMVTKFDQAAEGYEPQTARQIFRELAGSTGFGQYIDDPALGREASLGVQEALNELMAGALLVGNDLLLKGLRTRFPGTGDPADPDQLTLLKASVETFRAGINDVVEKLRMDPKSLRSRGTVNPAFPFYVENTRRSGDGQGDIVENELYRFTDLVVRAALAGNSVGKRKFFFENEDDNGREDAAGDLKRAAHSTYLHAAVLNAVENTTDFNNNNGYEMKRHVVDAQRVFDDILSGFNPLALRGDFVPHQPLESLLAIFDDLSRDAAAKEDAATTFARAYDTDQTALRSELQSQQSGDLSQMAALSGIPVSELASQYDLLRIEDRDRLTREAEKNLSAGKGELGQLFLGIEQATIDAKLALEEARQIPERIRIEEEREGRVARLVLANGVAFAAIDFAIQSNLVTEVCTCALASGVTFKPGYILNAALSSSRTLLGALQQAQIENINSAATIKNLLLQQASALLSLERAGVVIEERKSALEEGRARLQRSIRNYVAARANLAEAYFTNPAYRLQLDLARENAEASFQAAMVAGYFASKALEYEWAERVQNPVLRLDGGLAEPIGDIGTYNGIVAAESVFAARSAGSPSSPSPSLITFRQALRLWDSKMRQLRSPGTQVGDTVTISIRDDILGQDRTQFQSFVADHLVSGNNPQGKQDLLFEFALQIADQSILPALPNLKIESLGLNLRSRPGTSLRGAGSDGNAARVNLVMVDNALIRTFFADYPDDDDLLNIDLEGGRTFATSPFFAQVQSSIDAFPAVIAPNTQLQGHSPAVTRWTVWVDMENSANRDLQLENLDDIEINLTFRFGRPRPFTF